jgi:hypothetical protein
MAHKDSRRTLLRANCNLHLLFGAEKVDAGEKMTSHNVDNKGEIVLYQPDNALKLEVLVEDETVWLTQVQMAELFQITKQNVSLHINNAFSEGEFDQEQCVKEYLTDLADGRKFRIKHYNLDVIISVGYRVRSHRGTAFRRWATKILKEYILKGYAVNQRFERLEDRLATTEKKIEFFVNAALPPVQGVFFEGQIFDAYTFVSDLIKSAKSSIILTDNYVDETVLVLLSKRMPKVNAEIYTRQISPQLQLDLAKHNEQYEPIRIHESSRFHDRFLIIDNTVYHIGASLKDVGKKMFAFSRMEINATEVMKGL